MNAPEPDILFVANKNRDRLHRGGVEGPPDLAIEIVSPESVERDYDKKRRQYQRFKIPEYWIIDEHERKVTLLRLDARGKYREIAAAQGNLPQPGDGRLLARPELALAGPVPRRAGDPAIASRRMLVRRGVAMPSLVINLPGAIMPLERGEIFEDPLWDAFEAGGIEATITGGGPFARRGGRPAGRHRL